MASQIKAIPQSSVHKITSGQVVVDLQTAVKELVENSLDAGATSIEVRFKDYGLKAIEVIDNGSGIKPADYESIGLKHHTSKLASYSDLESVTSFGFRGEAISSLCALAEGVSMTTATEDEAPMGTVLEFDRMGKLVGKEGKVARQRGTTVTITNLFAPLPVRRAELSRNVKREHSKAVALLTAYAMVPCSQPPGVRLTVSNQPEGGKKTVQIRTDGSPSLRNNITALWGRKALDHMADINLQLSVPAASATLKRLPSSSQTTDIRMQGLASLPTFAASRTAADRQYLFLNHRPCTLPKVTKALAEVWHSFCVQGHGMWVLDLTLPTDAYDVNVSPDKRSILLHNEENILVALKAALEELWQPTRSTFAVNGGVSRSNSGGMASGGAVADAEEEEEDAEAEEEDQLDEEEQEEVKEPPKKLAKGLPSSRARSTSKGAAERATTWPAAALSKGRAEAGGGRRSKSSRAPDATETKESRPSDEPSAAMDDIQADDKPPAKDDEDDAVAQIFSPPTQATEMVDIPPVEETSQSLSINLPESSSSLFLTLPIRPPAIPAPSRSPKEAPVVLPHHDPPTPAKEPTSKRRKVSHDKGGQLSMSDFQKRLQRFASQNTTSGSALSQEGREDEDEDDGMDGEEDSDQEDLVPTGSLPDPFQVDTVEGPGGVVDLTEDIQMNYAPIVADKVATNAEEHGSNTGSGAKPTVEILRDGATSKCVLSVNMDRIRSKWSALSVVSSPAEKVNSEPRGTMAAAGLKVDSAEQAEATLSRVITKADFASMQILGQFNLGFIIVRLRKESEDGQKDYDELFIVDQHAADEKFNFETLQQTTRIQSQSLFRPRPLELTPADELVALENLSILRENGFEVEEVDIEIIDASSQERQSRLHLTAQPISKETVFDMKDLEELLHLMQDAPKGQMVRCSKARSMFAMRACRRSVMIGKALTRQQMTNVVRHMGTMDQPWNCPHGRPTMRHLLSLPDFLKRMSKKAEISWSDFDP